MAPSGISSELTNCRDFRYFSVKYSVHTDWQEGSKHDKSSQLAASE